jgi:cardiolipin synthase
MTDLGAAVFHWLTTGNEHHAAVRAALDNARNSIRFESYIYAPGEPGDTCRDCLIAAARRGVNVRVLLDAFGSLLLSEPYWDPLREAGGQVRWFNPLSLDRFNIRDHRKLLVCDDNLAIVGGFNVAPVCLGDGVNQGWRDVGLRLSGSLVPELAASFDVLFDRADFRHRRLARFRRRWANHRVATAEGELLLGSPGRGTGSIQRALQTDLAAANQVRIVSSYFLPPRRLRRALTRVTHRGGRVQLITAGKTDIPLMQAATRSLYGRLLRAGVEIHEYQPQVLHTKLALINRAAYVGSANLDIRSFRINYELMLRLTAPATVDEAVAIFESHLGHSRKIDPGQWRNSRTLAAKLKERLALFLFTRLDPLITRRQLRGFR